MDAVARVDTLRAVDFQGSVALQTPFRKKSSYGSEIQSHLLGRFNGLTTFWLRNVSDVDPAALRALVERNPLVSLKISNILLRDEQPVFASHVPHPPPTLRKVHFVAVAPMSMTGLEQFVSRAAGLHSLCLDAALNQNVLSVLQNLPSSMHSIKFYCWLPNPLPAVDSSRSLAPETLSEPTHAQHT